MKKSQNLKNKITKSKKQNLPLPLFPLLSLPTLFPLLSLPTLSPYSLSLSSPYSLSLSSLSFPLLFLPLFSLLSFPLFFLLSSPYSFSLVPILLRENLILDSPASECPDTRAGCPHF